MVEAEVSQAGSGDNQVLIVDDMRLNRQILGQMILEMGLEAVFAETGEEAVEKYQALNPSLILMDINMPGMDGIQATRKIKQAAEDSFIPIIFVTGAEGQDVIRQAIDAGGDDYIQRPFPFELLEGKIVALRRIAQLYRQVNRLNHLRAREEEVAEQLLSGAVESANVALDQIRIHKQPAETFSGDVQLSAFRPNGELNVLLGDFTGHGLTSTIGALPLSETFRAMTAKGYDAEEIIAQINRKLQKLLPTGMFLATAIVTLSPDGTAKIWNGGLPDILVISKGAVVQRIVSSHPPLGIIPSVKELNFEHTKVEPDDHILLLSDGVIEAENHKAEQFGEDRLYQSIAAQKNSPETHLVDIILSDLGDFVDGNIQKDDISLIDIPGSVTAEDIKPITPCGVELDVNESSILDIWNWNLELQGASLARINPVAQALSRLQESEGGGDQWHSVFSILTELYVNALDHGVLKLESSLKSSPEGFAEYFSEREKRLEALSSGAVALYLQHTRFAHGGRLLVRVEDSGEGFDYDHWLHSKKSSCAGQFSGRGIALVSDLCDSIRYENAGTAVEVVYSYSTKD
ncbi:ATP-binding SpoIIE family protein phosphatase [Neptuniibacter sp. QD37_11]|uniref:ATP-binding SpoIIE family protein phosphatase n=1 Tax=Neptuniibacter sp. QD37_11 TaxID=3398209 RepID=UPI0039F5BC40